MLFFDNEQLLELPFQLWKKLYLFLCVLKSTFFSSFKK